MLSHAAAALLPLRMLCIPGGVTWIDQPRFITCALHKGVHGINFCTVLVKPSSTKLCFSHCADLVLILLGGLTGFAVAKDLMKLDFSNLEEAPEEFRAVTFNAPPAKKGMRMPSLTALEIQTQGILTHSHCSSCSHLYLQSHMTHAYPYIHTHPWS